MSEKEKREKLTAEEARQAEVVLDTRKKRKRFLAIVIALLAILVLVYFFTAVSQ